MNASKRIIAFGKCYINFLKVNKLVLVCLSYSKTFIRNPSSPETSGWSAFPKSGNIYGKHTLTSVAMKNTN